MTKIFIVLSLILIFFGIGAWFVSYRQIPTKQTPTAPSPAQQANETTTTTKQLTGTDAIKDYAAKQFKIPVKNLKVVSSSNKVWKDTCFDMSLGPNACEKKETSGYEITFSINGQNITYRGNEEGTIIRIVKQ